MTSTIELAVERLGRARRPVAPTPAAAAAPSPGAAMLRSAAPTAAPQPRPQPVPAPAPVRLADAPADTVVTVDAVASAFVEVEPVEAPAPSARPMAPSRVATPVPAPPSSQPPWWSGERPAPWTRTSSPDGVERLADGPAPAAGGAAAEDPPRTASADAGRGGAVVGARDHAVEAHADDLPAEPADTTVAAAAEAAAHAILVRGERSARRALDLPRMARDGLLVPGGPLHAGADEFRAIKRALLRSVAGAAQQGSRRANLVLVTSATPGEGKTWCATNLALSLAGEVDHAALLVDVAGGLPACTGLPPTLPGLLDLLAHPMRLSVADIMVATQVPKFNLLPLGAPTPHAAELLASYAMDALLDELARRYRDRIVILDAPPVLGAGEVLHLAGQVGQVIVVVAQDQAPADTVRRAFGVLQEHPRVMAVFNRGASVGALHGRPVKGGAGG